LKMKGKGQKMKGEEKDANDDQTWWFLRLGDASDRDARSGLEAQAICANIREQLSATKSSVNSQRLKQKR
jgi:hypothetical protein